MAGPVPLIDLETALGPSAPPRLLEQARAGIRELGMLQVVNHGVPGELIEGFNERIQRLFARPWEEKSRLASPSGHPYRGWRQCPDTMGRLLVERLTVGQFDNPEQARAAGVLPEYAELYADGNVWPQDDPYLRERAFAFQDAAIGVAQRMLRLYERLLELPPGTFGSNGDRPPYTMLIVNDYPGWTYPQDPDEDQALLPGHIDHSVVTVLSQDGAYEGLQVQTPDGDWQPVPVIPGALQIINGGLLTRWTNGLLPAVRHRVLSGGSAARRSAAVFYHPSLDTTVTPLPSLAGPRGSRTRPALVWDLATSWVEDYFATHATPEQLRARRERRPYVADLAQVPTGG